MRPSFQYVVKASNMYTHKKRLNVDDNFRASWANFWVRLVLAYCALPRIDFAGRREKCALLGCCAALRLRVSHCLWPCRQWPAVLKSAAQARCERLRPFLGPVLFQLPGDMAATSQGRGGAAVNNIDRLRRLGEVRRLESGRPAPPCEAGCTHSRPARLKTCPTPGHPCCHPSL